MSLNTAQQTRTATAMHRTVAIQNRTPRVDVNGEIIDCHDGCLRHFEGRFYLYGTRYGRTDGFTTENQYVCYSSEDLVSWKPHGKLFRDAPEGVYYRPYVVWNPVTRLYVLWFNWYPKLWEGQLASAVSERPEGPFRPVDPDVKLRGSKPGDHNLFVDDDGRGYVIYTDIAGHGQGRHAISIERLTDDFTRSTLESSDVLDRCVEAPAMFKRAGRYYAVFGHTCCFGPEGADARVFLAERPLGPYRKIGDLNRDEQGKIVVPGQQTDIACIPGSDGPQFLWIADLWGSRPDGIKGHDLQYWSPPLEFEADGSIRPMTRSDAFELMLRLGDRDAKPATC